MNASTSLYQRRIRSQRGCSSIAQMWLRAVALVSVVILVKPVQGSSSPQIDMGTTILALRYKHGVIVGADTRTSVSGFVSNRYAEKISLVFGAHNKNNNNQRNEDNNNEQQRKDDEKDNQRPMPCIVLCRSGSAADTQYLADQVKWELQIRHLRHGIEPTVKQAAHLVRSIMREQGNHLSASLICAGFDNSATGSDENIFSILRGGSLLKESAFAVSGSGSTFIVGHMDHHLVNTDPVLMEEEDAIKFVVKAISLAIARDSSSGGFVRIYVMDRQRGLRSFIASPRELLPTTFESKKI